jgi:LemA protein
MEVGGIVLVVVIALVVIVALWAIATYNGLVRLRNLVQEAWRQVDVELHRRYDLIPNLLETVKGYAAHERAVFDEVTRARAAAANPGAGPAEQARQENVLSQALGRLFAVAEAYPQLRASENFTALQTELTNTEDRIASGRRYYNANVRTMNTRVETFPPNIIAGMFSFKRAEYFEANEPAVRQAPRVSFQDTSGSTGVYGSGPTAPGPADRSGGPLGGEPGGFPPGQGGGQPGYPPRD